MAKNKNSIKKNSAPGISHSIAPKSVYRTRIDIQQWNRSLDMFRNVEYPKSYPLQLLYNEISGDALLLSQLGNRISKSLKATFTISIGDKPDTDLSKDLQNKKWINDINRQILLSLFFGYSAFEFEFDKDGNFIVTPIKRTNLVPAKGLFYKDYTDDTNTIAYRDRKEYGTWFLEFGEADDLGLLNSCVPHVLFKKFAQSCWAELCEIYGIPPRVMKTNTHDKSMVARSEKMMRDMGSAAWFIIDSTEQFEFAKGVSTNGDVYQNLIQLCNNEMSMVISGAIIGQDTVNGNRSKDESAQVVLSDLVESDLSMIEMYWESSIIPALVRIGILPEGASLTYDKAENLGELWDRTKEAMPYYEIKPEWIKEKFGIEVEGKREANPLTALNIAERFFV
jgi:hypothetical protein